MYWTPYRLSDIKTINELFSKTEKSKILNIRAMKNFFKELIFDKNYIKNIKTQGVDRNLLQVYLQEGKITLQEYLYLCR